MRRALLLGAVLVLLVLAVSVIMFPGSGRFDGRSLLALVLAVAVVLAVPAVES